MVNSVFGIIGSVELAAPLQLLNTAVTSGIGLISNKLLTSACLLVCTSWESSQMLICFKHVSLGTWGSIVGFFLLR